MADDVHKSWWIYKFVVGLILDWAAKKGVARLWWVVDWLC